MGTVTSLRYFEPVPQFLSGPVRPYVAPAAPKPDEMRVALEVAGRAFALGFMALRAVVYLAIIRGARGVLRLVIGERD